MADMKEAWDLFNKAASFELKSNIAGRDGKENVARIAMRAADKKLDEACAIEAEVFKS